MFIVTKNNFMNTFRFFWGILCKDKYSYMTGWESARAGYPLNQNPHLYGSNEFNMWYIGWNDFVDNH